MHKLKYHVIPHVHWDREWYFTQNKSLVYSLKDFDEVIETLEENPMFSSYLLDAQTSILNDYLRYHPHMKSRVNKLVEAKRLLTGPWYTQSDQMVISGESIVRNLLYGINESLEYGHCFRVGYAVDCFGQSAQMPQIYSQLGIHSTIFKRGIDYNKLPYNEFKWAGPANHHILAYHAVDYMNMMNVGKTKEVLRDFFEDIENQYQKRSYSKSAFLFNGFDQFPVRKDLTDIIKTSKEIGVKDIQISNIEDVLDDISREIDSLPIYAGELTSGQTSRVHKSIFSSRADIKIKNNQLENLLSYIVEPLSSLNKRLGGNYEHTLIKEMWKLMMENASHDSIGTCNSDEVNNQIMSRYNIVDSTMSNLVDLIKREIAVSMQGATIFQFQMYNLLPYSRKDFVKFTVLSPYQEISILSSADKIFEATVVSSKDVTSAVKDVWKKRVGISGNYDESIFEINAIYELEVIAEVALEAMGYETFNIVQGCLEQDSEKQSWIENEFYKIVVKENSVDLLVKAEEKWYKSFIKLQDNADDGDSYDYSEFENDWIIDIEDIDSESINIENLGSTQILNYRYYINLPFDLDNRKNRVTPIEQGIDCKITLTSTSPLIRVDVKLENKAVEHRLRLIVNSQIPSASSFADQQFGWIERPTTLDEVNVWEAQKWSEKPRTIEPLQSWVLLKNEQRSVGVITDNVREYEVVGDRLDTIAMTLFRSYRWMGKSDLRDRPGRASGKEWATPDNELLKQLDFTYYLNFSNASIKETDALAKHIVSPILVHQELSYRTSADEFNIMETPEKNYPNSLSLFNVKDEKLGFSTLKKAENSDDLIVRFYGLEDSIVPEFSGYQATKVLLDEETITTYQTSVTQNEIVTLRLGGKYEKN